MTLVDHMKLLTCGNDLDRLRCAWMGTQRVWHLRLVTAA